ncbi:hypothetical protein [Xylella fastidiosa]|uniref:hypothetical protein n=1 Tax=Xylella fastidiosa TaxID=2371 RepID=UPI000FFEFA04|nr:hypothetical protein [Xylella fastidiosa]RWA36992.1 hypothetical protein XfCFBP8078_09995 [Xylella fastidiosa subsp. multiplex]
MSRICEIWEAYAMLIVEALSAYYHKTEHLPFVVSFGLLLVPMFLADWFLPRWASLSLYAAIGLPLAWFLGMIFWVFFTHKSQRDDH